MNLIERSGVTPQWMIEKGFSESFASRFWKYVTITDSCWIWNGSMRRYGYGVLRMGGRGFGFVSAHVASWMMRNGPIPKETPWVLHDCPVRDNPSCVNPGHLWLGTPDDNSKDLVAKHNTCRGERQGSRKLTWESVGQIRSRWPSESTYQLARCFGVSQGVIFSVVKFKSWVTFETSASVRS